MQTKKIIVVAKAKHFKDVSISEGTISYKSEKKAYKALAEEIIDNLKIGIETMIYLPDDFEM